MSREQPEQQAPPVQRLRIRYAKRGRLRFTSHRDFSRAFERAVVRARVPMAYSSGFNPHPRISYAGAAPTGAASEAEYLEIGLATEVDPDDVRRQLAAAMPDGLDIVEVVVSPGGGVADLLEASHWLIEVELPHDVAREAVAGFLTGGAVTVERMTKKGVREFDCRAPVLALTVLDPDPAGDTPVPGTPSRTRLELVLRHAVPSVRPDDVLSGLARSAGLEITGGALLTRLAQGPLDEETGSIGDPLRAGR